MKDNYTVLLILLAIYIPVIIVGFIRSNQKKIKAWFPKYWGFKINMGRVRKIKMSLPTRAVDVYLRSELFEDGHEEFCLVYFLNGRESTKKIKDCKKASLLSVDPMWIPGSENKGYNDYRQVEIELYL